MSQLYGLDKEIHEKIASKYDPEKQAAAQTWIETVGSSNHHHIAITIANDLDRYLFDFIHSLDEHDAYVCVCLSL